MSFRRPSKKHSVKVHQNSNHALAPILPARALHGLGRQRCGSLDQALNCGMVDHKEKLDATHTNEAEIGEWGSVALVQGDPVDAHAATPHTAQAELPAPVEHKLCLVPAHRGPKCSHTMKCLHTMRYCILWLAKSLPSMQWCACLTPQSLRPSHLPRHMLPVSLARQVHIHLALGLGVAPQQHSRPELQSEGNMGCVGRQAGRQDAEVQRLTVGRQGGWRW
jgi:hypothetical protein